ncbi:MAG: 4-(cytidine 5'-diphospho)-2-C-methyl-D-erythritol kinase [Candidatus Limnocylindrales bacterium]
MSPDRTDRLAAPAKVNLTLAVAARRADGFHDLDSVLLRLDLADRLEVRMSGAPPSADSAADGLTLTGPQPCPLPGNLVLRAAAVLRQHVGRPLPPLVFHLRKEVPVAAGLGGGSSDAAAALRLAAGVWDVDLDQATLLELAADLGSDVPFFALDAPAARATGRGERLSRLPAPVGRLACLLAVAHEGLSTAGVFEAFDREARPVDGAAQVSQRLAGALARGLPAGQLVESAAELRDANDLWSTVARLRPDIVHVREDLEQRSGRPWLLSGSGPTLFALYASRAEAERALAHVGRSSDGVGGAVRLLVSGSPQGDTS